MIQRLILVKHAMPEIEEARPPKDWQLGDLGRRQSEALARSMARPGLGSIYTSREPKAQQTAHILAQRLGRENIPFDGLQEFDRPPLPVMSHDEHARLNRQIFEYPHRRLLGQESANSALDRFDAAILKLIQAEQQTKGNTAVVVTHGTVISLFVAKYNAIDAFEIWSKLSCPSYVELEYPRFKLLNSVFQVPA